MVTDNVEAENRCTCNHKKNQHRSYRRECDNCGCTKYQFSLANTEKALELAGSMCVVPDGTTPPSQTSDIETDAGSDRGSASLKDSGQRLQFASGMVRDIEDDKPGFHFLIPKNVPHDKQMLTRVAQHLRNGAKKYEPRNWEKGDSDEEAERARESALRHMMQWIMGETDEDHAAAVITNVIFAETMQWKANQKKENA